MGAREQLVRCVTEMAARAKRDAKTYGEGLVIRNTSDFSTP